MATNKQLCVFLQKYWGWLLIGGFWAWGLTGLFWDMIRYW